MRTTLVTLNGPPVGLEMLAVTLSFDKRLDERWNLSGAVGAITGGWFTADDGVFGAGRGGVASFAVTRTLVQNKGAVPFVLLSASLTASALDTRAGLYVGTDLRGAVTAGWTLWDRFSPYLAARAFGGLAFWRGGVYSDRYHFQLGVGFVVGLPEGLDLSAEVVPLGEQRISVGLGYSF